MMKILILLGVVEVVSANAVNGHWADWGACSKTCGGGSASRTCSNPAASGGGADCVGDKTKTCSTVQCAIHKCTFTPARAGAHNPNCLGKWSWSMNEALGDVQDPAPIYHNYRCCLDKLPGWQTAGKEQNTCADVASQTCTDIKADDIACRTGDVKTTAYFSVGYKTTDCNNYADDCRASLQCDTDAGFSGHADLACQSGLTDNFLLRGCSRGDAGTLGTDLTRLVYVVAPNIAPKQTGTAKSSYNDCKSNAQSTKAFAWVSGNGGCDHDNVCYGPDTCEVLPLDWNKEVQPSESEDMYVRLQNFKSNINERCITLANNNQPTGNEALIDCAANKLSNTDTASYGGFDFYGDRFSCWRNIGGAVRVAKSTQMIAFDLTYEVMTTDANAGLGVTLYEYLNGGTGTYAGIWNGGADGTGFGVCTGAGPSSGGCTAELAALMCEAYNRDLVKKGATDTTKFCTGFSLQESSAQPLGCTAKKKCNKYQATHDYDMLVGFFSNAGKDDYRDANLNFHGGYFKYVPVSNCLVTSSRDCSKCEQCVSTHVLSSTGECITACPKFQYSKDGVCTYRAPHCIEGNPDGTLCTKCQTGFDVSIDGSKCEEVGCKVPNPMKSAGNVDLVGAVQGTSPACSADANIVPGSACGIACTSGQTSIDNSKTVVYSCPSVRPSDGKPTNPTIVCGPCTIDKCALCPTDPGCAQCSNGYKLISASPANTCEVEATMDGDNLKKSHANTKGTYCASEKAFIFVVHDEGDGGKFYYKMSKITIAEAQASTGAFNTGPTAFIGPANAGTINIADPATVCLMWAGTGFTNHQQQNVASRLKYDMKDIKVTGCDSCAGVTCPVSTETAGECTSCAEGTAGTLAWNAISSTWDTSACEACTVAQCKDCKGNKDECVTCNTGYAVKDALKKECIPMETCGYGETGSVTYNSATQTFDKSACKASTVKCEDESQTAGSCTDCKDGYAGSVDWDYTKQEWNKEQCHPVACPLSTETAPTCTKCPEFQTGDPTWDDLFNVWVGCIANDFGFSGPSASWAEGIEASASVSASYATVSASFATADFATVAAELNVASLSEPYQIETISAEMLHVANFQYDAVSDQWVCDEGYAGVGCKQRLCPETVAFTSGTDGFTPSKSEGFFFTTDAGLGSSATFSNQHSYRECGGRGTCDFETGLCQCFPGFTGVGCRRTTCPNGCSGHGVCMNDDVSNYHAAGRTFLPSDDTDINTWGNLWSSNKFQGCKCDGGWSGNDCSLRQCPRGDDPETQCADNLGNDVQHIECTNVFPTKDHFFKLRFTDQLGNRYNTRAIVLNGNDKFVSTMSDAVFAAESLDYTKALSHSIQTALESLPNFVVPKLEVTTPEKINIPRNVVQNKKKGKVISETITYTVDQKFTIKFDLAFTDARNSGKQAMLELEADMKCASGVQPKFENVAGQNPTCTVTRKEQSDSVLRENAECSNRGLCNRKTAECNCFDGYTGLACDTVAQTY